MRLRGAGQVQNTVSAAQKESGQVGAATLNLFFLNGPNRSVKETVAAVVRTELGELRMVQATHPTHRRSPVN